MNSLVACNKVSRATRNIIESFSASAIATFLLLLSELVFILSICLKNMYVLVVNILYCLHELSNFLAHIDYPSLGACERYCRSKEMLNLSEQARRQGFSASRQKGCWLGQSQSHSRRTTSKCRCKTSGPEGPKESVQGRAQRQRYRLPVQWRLFMAKSRDSP